MWSQNNDKNNAKKLTIFFLLLFSSSRPFIYIAQFFFIETDNTLVRSLCFYAVVTHFKTLFSASFFEVAGFFSFTTKTILLERFTTILSYELQLFSSSLFLVFYLLIYFDSDQSSTPERFDELMVICKNQCHFW